MTPIKTATTVAPEKKNGSINAASEGAPYAASSGGRVNQSMHKKAGAYEGGSYAEIGTTLHLSPDTIRAHAQRAMSKLGARTRTQAVAVALRDGLVA